MSTHKPFSRDEFPDLTRAISEIVAPKPKKPTEKKTEKPDKWDKWGGKEPYVKNDRNPYTRPHGVQESHTRAQLEKLSTTRLRELLKKYTGKPGSGRELADIRGLLRARGAGVVLDEGFEADERAAARSARVRKWMGRLKRANAADLKDKPGAAGEAAHKRLHATIGKVLGESATKAALEDWMYSIPPAAVEDLRPVMRIKNLTKRFAAITKTLKAHGFTTRFMGSMPANVVNDYYDTFFGVVEEQALTPAEIRKRLEPGRAAQRPRIRAALKAKLKTRHGQPGGASGRGTPPQGLVGEGVSGSRAPGRKPAPKKPDPHAGARGVIGREKAVQKRLQKYGMRW